jgi:predicted enzyme related to lactoylglutathione lyase
MISSGAIKELEQHIANTHKAAAKFQGDVISWSAQEHPIADGATCTMFSKGPVIVAGLMAIPEAMRAEEVPPCWSGYVSTDDVDARRDPVPAQGSRMSDALPVLPIATARCSLLFKSKTTEEPNPVARNEPCTRRSNPAWPVEVPDGA